MMSHAYAILYAMEERKVVDASPRKISDARSRGHVAQSDLCLLGASLLTLVVWLTQGRPEWVSSWSDWLREGLSRAPHGDISTQIGGAALSLLRGVGPWILALMLVVPVMTWLQTGPLWAGRALGVHRGVPSKSSGLATTLRFGALSLLVLVTFVAVGVAFAEAWLTLCTGSISDLVETSSRSVVYGTLIVGVALLVVGIVDLAILRWLERRALKMSRREAKERERDEVGAPEMRHYHERMRRRSQRVDYRIEVRRAMMLVTGFGDWVIFLHGGSPPTVGQRVRGELASVVLARARVEGVLIGHDPALGYTLISVPVGQRIPRSAYGPVSRWRLRAPRTRIVA